MPNFLKTTFWIATLVAVGYVGRMAMLPKPEPQGAFHAAPVQRSETQSAPPPSNFFRAPLLARGSSTRSISPSKLDTAPETILVPSQTGGLETVPKQSYDAKQRVEQDAWEEARRADEEGAKNRPLRANEDALLRGLGSARIGMTTDEVVKMLGEPNRITAPHTRSINKRGETIVGSVFFSRQQLAGKEGEVFFVYTPHPSGRAFNKPGESFKVVTVGIGHDGRANYFHTGIPHPTIYVE